MKVKDFIKDDAVYPMVIDSIDGSRYVEITGNEILETYDTSDCGTISFANTDRDIKQVFEQNGVTSALEVVIFVEDGECIFIAISK